MEYNDSIIEWLLESNPWTRYITLTELLDYPQDDTRVVLAKNELIESNQVQSLIDETSLWFQNKSKRHDDSTMAHYRLRILSDFGLRVNDPKLSGIIDEAKKHRRNELYTIMQELPEKDRVDPNEEWNALPCDSPLITFTLMKLGDTSNETRRSIEVLKEKWKSNGGWFCNLFFVKSQFKKTQVGCPMAALQYLEVLSLLETDDDYIEKVFYPIKYHYEIKKSLYYFGRGKRFWTLKYPFVWYNALYMAEVLTKFECLRDEPLVKGLIEYLESQVQDGKYTPTSMFRAYKDWGFANKKDPSPWISLRVYMILKRYYSYKA